MFNLTNDATQQKKQSIPKKKNSTKGGLILYEDRKGRLLRGSKA